MNFLSMCALSLLELWCISAAAQDEIFSSTDSGPRASDCGSAYAACVAQRAVEESNNPRYRAAGQLCEGHLANALWLETELNAANENVKTLSGDARSNFVRHTLTPINSQRVESLREFRTCIADTMPDLRPEDYPRSPVLLQGYVSTEDPAALLARRLEELGEQLGTSGGRFLDGVIDWAIESATFLAQEPGKPVEQILQGTGTLLFEAVPAYMTNNNADNHRQLYEAADKGLQEFAKDPAYALGKTAPNLIPVGTINRAKALSSLQKTATALQQTVRRKALPGGLAREVEEAMAKRPSAARPGPDVVDPPPGTDGFPLDRPPTADVSPVPPDQLETLMQQPVNACRGRENCFYTQIAHDLREQYGQPFTAPAGSVGSWDEVTNVMRELYGGPAAKNPYHGTGGQQLHADGQFVLSDRQRIENALRHAAENESFFDAYGNPVVPNPSGMVIVWKGDMVHAIDARWAGTRTAFTDHQAFGADAARFLDSPDQVAFFRQR
ncbi:MAG: hypothetical protein KDK91_32695 [Gammaproteobacteria bacterium]|nr:hypothetical protein [Gammaproteobacteria bacterium]